MSTPSWLAYNLAVAGTAIALIHDWPAADHSDDLPPRSCRSAVTALNRIAQGSQGDDTSSGLRKRQAPGNR